MWLGLVAESSGMASKYRLLWNAALHVSIKLLLILAIISLTGSLIVSPTVEKSSARDLEIDLIPSLARKNTSLFTSATDLPAIHPILLEIVWTVHSAALLVSDSTLVPDVTVVLGVTSTR